MEKKIRKVLGALLLALGVLMICFGPLSPSWIWSLGWMACVYGGCHLMGIWDIGPIRDALREYDERGRI